MKTILTCLWAACLLVAFPAPNTQAQSYATASFSRTTLTGIGPDKKVSRRDPSDVIKVGDLYYVWYSRGPVKTGYDATVWYATSSDGVNWTEQGEAVAKGETGAWDEASVFTPNILVAEGKYWLFYTAVSTNPKVKPDSKIGIAVSNSPDGPWQKLATNPVLKNSDTPSDFDSHLVDDSCLLVRDGKYWLYYKGRQLGRSPAETKMGLAIAESPGGPYIRHPENPVIPGNHEVVIWPQGSGVVAMVDGHGPKETANSILFAEDGIHFAKTHDVIDRPKAGGTYRPEAFTDSNQGEAPTWGVEMDPAGKLLCIQRVDIEWKESNENE
ncbi:family 43 glycosylhydrolase [Aporhodopirellula aestuarii]|uniref:Family 43 glycosylhydrolase n=1 Tax=Aporhodopirellula aestuarii TaxID=2950107 RepID=A0ABT0UDQ9_9BACT|nr:family 43 glycosylhydrolase [Aporhodopirellula aestuarii]MCM2375193.1 family 43 glycosylhydrolase [Aporhodopirellula aestuarii]